MLGRLIFNSLHALKKDNGAYFTYNIGVGFIRAGTVLIVIAALVFSWYHFKLFPVLEYEDDTTVTLMGYWTVHENPSDIEWFNEHFAKYRYYIVIKYVGYGDTETTISEYVSEETYRYFEALDLGASGIPMKRYWTDRRFGYLYLSQKNSVDAAKECQAAYPPVSSQNNAFWILLAAVPLILIGLKQQRLAMKYPRSDVDINGTALAPYEGEETDESAERMREFDEAYEQFERNKAAGLPTSVPPRTDGKYRLEQRRDTDENRSDNEEADI